MFRNATVTNVQVEEYLPRVQSDESKEFLETRLQLAQNLIGKTKTIEPFIQEGTRRVYSLESDLGTPALVHFVEFADLGLGDWARFT